MRQFHHFVLISLISLFPLGACTYPDITDGVTSLSSSLEVATKRAGPSLTRGVQAEAAREKDRQTRARALIYDYPTDCIAVSFGVTSLGAEDEFQPGKCVLGATYALPLVRGTAAYASEGFAALKSYEKVLKAINDSKVGPGTAENFASMVGSLNAFKAASGATSGAVVKKAEIAPMSSLLGKYVEARRARIVKQLVNTAHDDILLIVSELIAHFETSDRLNVAANRLAKAHSRMTTAKDSGSIQSYRRAVANYEASFNWYSKRLKNSHSAPLLAVWKSQQLLHKQVNTPGDIDGLIALLNDIEALKVN